MYVVKVGWVMSEVHVKLVMISRRMGGKSVELSVRDLISIETTGREGRRQKHMCR